MYLICCIILAGLIGVLDYWYSIESFKRHKSEATITALELIDAFVTTYSSIASDIPNSPIPAAYRAHSIERFNRTKGPDSDFSLEWVGRHGREIKTPPGDDLTATKIEEFVGSISPQPLAMFVDAGDRPVLRTIYPSLAREQSCVDCHNALQIGKQQWLVNDVMGAFVVDVPSAQVMHEAKQKSFGVSTIALAILSTIGLAFSIQHFRQSELSEAVEDELARRVSAQTAKLHDARAELINKHQLEVRHLDWLRRLARFLRHEVRQPVAQITSSVELIQLNGQGDRAIEPYAASASQAAQHVWNLVERASRATDVEAFVREGKDQDVLLSALLGEAVGGFQQTFSGLQFRLDVIEDAEVVADPMLLKEAVGNLLTNAASFAAEGSTVSIRLSRDGDHAAIAVLNKGPLIEGDGEELFGPFASTRAGPSSEHHGLGLYLVRLVAEHWGGQAAIANHKDGSGVAATIVWPMRVSA